MKKNKFQLAVLSALLAVGLLVSAAPVPAQRTVKTDSRILYHNGPVMDGTSNVYVIWYGNWVGNPEAIQIIADLTIGLSGSPYFFINTTYPNALGNAPSGYLFYGGSVGDNYGQGTSLDAEKIELTIENLMLNGGLPLDGAGIYMVVASADVTDVRADGSNFCTSGSRPQHSTGVFNGFPYKYGFVGSPNRCWPIAAPQFVAPDGTRLPTPNANFEADGLATTFARLLNGIVTNPLGYGGWYDRYGLENSEKCVGRYGATYTRPNGARANTQIGLRHFLLQENWINDRRGRCTLSASL
jgi:hypothetical protein